MREVIRGMGKLYTAEEFSKIIGRSVQTIKLWSKKGKINPALISALGVWFYSDEQIESVMGIKTISDKVIGFCRGAKGSVGVQEEFLKEFLSLRGEKFEIIYSSNVNEIAKKISVGDVGELVVFNKDVLGEDESLIRAISEAKNCVLTIMCEETEVRDGDIEMTGEDEKNSE